MSQIANAILSTGNPIGLGRLSLSGLEFAHQLIESKERKIGCHYLVRGLPIG